MLFLLTYSVTHDYNVSVVVVCSSHTLMCFSPSSLPSWMVVQPLPLRESKVSCKGPSSACSVLYKLFVPCADALQYQNRLRIPASAPWPAAIPSLSGTGHRAKASAHLWQAAFWGFTTFLLCAPCSVLHALESVFSSCGLFLCWPLSWPRSQGSKSILHSQCPPI